MTGPQRPCAIPVSVYSGERPRDANEREPTALTYSTGPLRVSQCKARHLSLGTPQASFLTPFLTPTPSSPSSICFRRRDIVSHLHSFSSPQQPRNFTRCSHSFRPNHSPRSSVVFSASSSRIWPENSLPPIALSKPTPQRSDTLPPGSENVKPPSSDDDHTLPTSIAVSFYSATDVFRPNPSHLAQSSGSVNVCDAVFAPIAIDPLFDHRFNYTGRSVHRFRWLDLSFTIIST